MDAIRGKSLNFMKILYITELVYCTAISRGTGGNKSLSDKWQRFIQGCETLLNLSKILSLVSCHFEPLLDSLAPARCLHITCAPQLVKTVSAEAFKNKCNATVTAFQYHLI